MSLDQASAADDSYFSGPSYPQGIPRSEAMHDLRAVHSNLELARAYMKNEGVNSSASSVLMDSTNQKRISSPSSAENNSPRSSIHLNRNESNVLMTKHIFSTTFSPAHRKSQREPHLNPALLSQVARAFEAQILPTERFKNELTYTHAFDGREAVQTLMNICKTQDRNLALLVGRALDAQKFFHEVTYDHRLRDSPTALYQFWNRGFGPLPFGVSSPEVMSRKVSAGSLSAGRALQQLTDLDSNPRRGATEPPQEDAVWYPTGVFTLLTKCYSPTCSPATPCYSSQALTQTLSNSDSNEGLVNIDSHLWAETVSQDVYESVPERERKRQEVIFEIIATERQYVQDLEYLRTIWIQPLSTQHIVPPPRREEFVQKVFCNLLDILAVNMRLAEMLTRRQKHHSVVEYIGDIFAEMVQQFEPYVEYGANQASARIRVASERSSNPVFDMFVADTERKVVSRKLELNGYLTKPTTRLARYPLLFEQLLKYTSEDNVDKTVLPRVIQHIQRLLNRVNDATGRSENRIQIGFLSKQLVFKPQDMVDLRLEDENRELVFRSALKKRGTQSDSSEIQVYLFDHALLMVKIKIVHKTEVYRVYRRPIPLELLQVTIYEDGNIHKGQKPRAIHSCSSMGHRTSVGPSPGNPIPKQDAKSGYAITFTYLGKHGYSLTLWASTLSGRDKWFEHAEARQEIVRQQSCIFDLIPVSSMLMDQGSSRIICGVPFNFGRQVFFGKEDGVYLSYMRELNRTPTLALPLTGVTQIDLLEEYQILLVLAEQVLYTFTLDALDTADPAGSLRRGRRIASHTSFFRAGICMGRTLVCVVKSGSLSSTIKILEPIECSLRMKKQPALRKLRPGAQDALRVFKEFYIPTESSSIHFFKSKLCMGTPKGFEIVDLETLDTQGLLDPADISLDFVQRRENLKPIAIFRVDGEFLLCYNEFAFFVNKNGWRARSDWIVHWEGNPNAFAIHYPYILAFEPSFIEVRHIETGALHQVIMGYNMRCLFADSLPSRLHGSRTAKSGFSHPMRTVMLNAAHGEPLPDSSMNSSSDMSGAASFKSGAIPTPRQGTSAWGSPVMGSPIMSPGPMNQSFSSASPHAMAMNTAPTPLVPSSHVPILDSMVQSRGEILFVGDSAPYIIRMHSSIM
ncbi:RHO1 GDP-GTP exchange protein 2 [Malassezia nana]|uniref:RHO1 GDP-GTP exchange protein 2 n=1 Tax=Malassezia nana TaxID=180528 RepID=A0AAF0ELU9_9BASI|nr:RHO1 GDP-GTP exchange protein 2 [Malassezia nana]